MNFPHHFNKNEYCQLCVCVCVGGTKYSSRQRVCLNNLCTSQSFLFTLRVSTKVVWLSNKCSVVIVAISNLNICLILFTSHIYMFDKIVINTCTAKM